MYTTPKLPAPLFRLFRIPFPLNSCRLLCTANAIVGTEFRSAQMETVNHVLYLSTGSYSQFVCLSVCPFVRAVVQVAVACCLVSF